MSNQHQIQSVRGFFPLPLPQPQSGHSSFGDLIVSTRRIFMITRPNSPTLRDHLQAPKLIASSIIGAKHSLGYER